MIMCRNYSVPPCFDDIHLSEDLSNRFLIKIPWLIRKTGFFLEDKDQDENAARKHLEWIAQTYLAENNFNPQHTLDAMSW